MLNTISFDQMEHQSENQTENKINHNGGYQNNLEYKPISERKIISENKILTPNRAIDNINKTLDESVLIDDTKEKFIFFDGIKREIGFFTVNHLVKYLSVQYDTQNQFKPFNTMNSEEEKEYITAKAIIKKYIFRLDYNKEIGYTEIHIFDYIESGFMGNIDLLLALNNMIDNYNSVRLKNDLDSVEKESKIKIEHNIKKFTFLLLNYTLKLISKSSEQFPVEKLLMENLIRYSIGLVYKINIFVQEQLKIIHDQNIHIEDIIKNCNTIKRKIN